MNIIIKTINTVQTIALLCRLASFKVSKFEKSVEAEGGEELLGIYDDEIVGGSGMVNA